MTDDLDTGVVGIMQTPRTSYNLARIAVWALDNGCFTGVYPGDDQYMRKLGIWDEHRGRCLFVAVPDVLGDAEATIRMWTGMSRRIREAGWVPALVAQDGMTEADLPDDLLWLFIGGSTDWKLGPDCRILIMEAKARGIRVHVGRVNSRRRFRYFSEMGCDTADGTFVAFGPKVNYPFIGEWTREHSQQAMI